MPMDSVTIYFPELQQTHLSKYIESEFLIHAIREQVGPFDQAYKYLQVRLATVGLYPGTFG